MSRNKLKVAASEFIENAGWLKNLNKFYYIDFLFPSIGIADLLTSHFRSNFTLGKDDRKLLFEISAYLTEYVAQCWEECGLSLDVFFDENGGIISIQGLSEKPIHLQSIFSQMLSNIPNELYLDRKNKIPVTPLGDYVCLFMQGFLRGAYFEDSEHVDALFSDDFNAQMDKVLARQYARWHEEVFPALTISHLPELYLFCLKNKHFLASEEAPLLKEVKEFVKYFRALNIDPAMAGRKLCNAFIGSPSEYLSLLGTALLGGLNVNEPSIEEALPNLKVRGFAIPLVREAFYFFRETINESQDWIESSAIDGAQLKLVEVERQIGFLPWLRLSTKYVGGNLDKGDALRSFLRLVKEGSFFLAQNILDSELEKDPANIEFRIQRAFFYYITKDLDSGHEYCKKLLSENNIERYYEFFSVWGAILLDLKQVEVATRYLKLAYNAGDCPKYRKAEIGNSLAWCYILQGYNEEAKVILDEILTYPSLEQASILLNRLFISEKSDGMPKDLLSALKLAPMDRRVFNNVIMLGKARVEKGELKV